MKDQFYLKIDGDDVSPETVDLSALLQLLGHFDKAVQATARQAGTEPKDSSLHLVGVSEGSDKLTFQAPRPMIAAVRTIARAVNAGDKTLLPRESSRSLNGMWKVMSENEWDECQVIGNGSAIPTMRISIESEPFPEEPTHRGASVIYGDCIRAGGISKKTASIKLINGQSLTVHLKSRELAKELGRRLYQTVGLAGKGVWSSRTNQLVGFFATGITAFVDRDEGSQRRRTFREAIEGLSKAAGDRWKNVDPDQFMNDQRRD